MTANIDEVQEYWNTHLNLTQFLEEEGQNVASDEDLFRGIEATLGRYSYKDPLLRQFADGAGGATLLEVGCGLGVELARLAELGFRVTGVDLGDRAVEVCNRYLRWKGVEGRAVVGNAEDLEFPDSSFDAVYSSGVLQHTPDIQRAIGEIRRVLRPGGRLLVILYHRHSWLYLLHKLTGTNIEFASEDAPIINAYTRKELHQLFADFDDVSISCEYYRPLRTSREGLLAALYNRLFVPAVGLLPAPVIRRFGWHLVLTASG